MIRTDVLVIGGGPAGMSAALAVAKHGGRVILADNGKTLGGQLTKQTHRFFGSEREYAGTRGFDIAARLREEIKKYHQLTVMTDTTIEGIYNDGVITYLTGDDCYGKLSADRIIVATGAREKMLPFENNDLPGVYGAGAVQTLMNLYGVVPGNRVLMVGAGNIGLIVSYQLIQAGVEVAAVIDAADKIGGYLVHAAKLRRLGVPILTRHTVLRAEGTDCVVGATIAQLNDQFQVIPGTDQEVDVDTICLSVGLTPYNALLRKFNLDVEMGYVPQLGGFVPKRDRYLHTSRPNVYVAGDVSCIEEASSAMVEGSIAGLSAMIDLGLGRQNLTGERECYIHELEQLRAGAAGEKIRSGLQRLAQSK